MSHLLARTVRRSTGTARAELVRAKLKIPPSGPKLVDRPRLSRLLDQWPQRRLTLVNAPAGYGKTALTAAWAAGQPEDGPVGWLTLDRADRDPRRFWSYVLAALARTGALPPPAGQLAAGQLGAGQLASGQLASGALVFRPDTVGPLALGWPALGSPVSGELAGSVSGSVSGSVAGGPDGRLDVLSALQSLTRPVVLVVDEADAIAGTAAARSLALWLRLPSPLHLVLCSRIEPPLPVGRLRVSDEVAVLDTAALAFTADEITELAALHGLLLTAAQSRALAARSEGWIAGLYLALAGQPDVDADAVLARLVGDAGPIADYLREEVLDRQPAGTRDWLLRTSVLHRLEPGSVAAVTGQPDGGLLEQLRRGNAFLLPALAPALPLATAGTPETGEPEAGEPEAGEPEAGEPEAGTSEAGQPEAGKRGAGNPEAGRP